MQPEKVLIVVSKNTKNSLHAWGTLEKLMLSLPKGPKTNCVEEIDLAL